MTKFRALCAMLMCWAATAGAVIAPSSQDNELLIGRDLSVLVDPEGRWTIADVSGSFMDRFQPSAQLYPNYGFTSARIWLRFEVDFSSVLDRPWYLIQRHPIIDHLVLYAPDGVGGFRAIEMGDTRPFGERIFNHREFIFPLDSSVAGRQTYYLEVWGKGALNLELKLASAQGLVERTYREQMLFGLFFGGLLVMLIYNFLLFFSLRETTYLYYVVFLGSLIISLLNLNGFGLQYLWPSWPKINEHYPFFVTIGAAALLRYSLIFLDVASRMPAAERWLQWLFRISVVMVPVSVFLPAPWSYLTNTALVLVVVLSLFAIGWIVWLKGYTAARLYVIAWSLFLLGCVVFSLSNLGLMPHSPLTNYAPHIGGGWVAVLLSLALGDRINLLEYQRDSLSQESEEAMRRHVAEVEQLDRDKLVFMGYLSHELNTPLNWLGSAKMLETESVPKELRDAVRMVQRGQERLHQLVATSLRYFDLAGRDQQPAHGYCQPMWMLDRMLPDIAAALDAKSLRVINRIPAELSVLACEGELREVFSMLLDNAIRVSPENGVIEWLGLREADALVIRVEDQGQGIPREQLESIFRPFFMVGSGHHVDGFGLSLPMARVMISQMGGQIWAESAGPGKGAAICLRLPLAAA